MENRYDSFERLGWWRLDAVEHASVLVVGAGTLGAEVLKNLALMGVGRLIVVDFDRVEKHNISRSVLFRDRHLGMAKVDAARDALRDLAAQCDVIALNGDFRLVGGPGLAARVSAVIGCVDSVEARLALNDAAGTAGTPFIDGGLLPWEGTVTGFDIGPHGACYACTLDETDMEALRLRRSCAAEARRAEASAGIPTTPVVASLIGAVIAQECLNLLHDDRGTPPSLAGRQLRYNMAINRSWNMALSRNPDCPAHPEPVKPVRFADIERSTPWARVRACALDLAKDDRATVQLPFAVARYAACESCANARTAWSARSISTALFCPQCGAAREGEVDIRLDAAVDWINESPGSLGAPPFAWVTWMTASDIGVLEIGGGGNALGVLDHAL